MTGHNLVLSSRARETRQFGGYQLHLLLTKKLQGSRNGTCQKSSHILMHYRLIFFVCSSTRSDAFPKKIEGVGLSKRELSKRKRMTSGTLAS